MTTPIKRNYFVNLYRYLRYPKFREFINLEIACRRVEFDDEYRIINIEFKKKMENLRKLLKIRKILNKSSEIYSRSLKLFKTATYI